MSKLSVEKVYLFAGNKGFIGKNVRDVFENLGCEVVSNFQDCDTVCFTGGADISPALYGQENHLRTYPDKSRDSSDMYMLYRALEENKNLIGICRGAQLIHAVNGGSLYQDVDKHRSKHPVKLHGLSIKSVGKEPVVSSTHHQMMVLPDKSSPRYNLLVSASVSTYRDTVKNGVTVVNSAEDHVDVEALYYPDIKALCFQGHPEYGSATCDSEAIFAACVKKCFKKNTARKV